MLYIKCTEDYKLQKLLFIRALVLDFSSFSKVCVSNPLGPGIVQISNCSMDHSIFTVAGEALSCSENVNLLVGSHYV